MKQRFLLMLDSVDGRIVEAGTAAELAEALVLAWHDLAGFCAAAHRSLSLFVEVQDEEGRHRTRLLDHVAVHDSEARARAYIAGRAQRWLDAVIPGKWTRTLLYAEPETVVIRNPLERPREPRTLPEFHRLDVR